MSGGNTSQSLDFQVDNQPKPFKQEVFFLELASNQSQPSRKRKFILQCSDFRCPNCVSEQLRCSSCITLVNIATKEHFYARRRVQYVITAFEKSPTKEKFSWAEGEVQKAVDAYDKVVSPESVHGCISMYFAEEANRQIRDNLVDVKFRREVVRDRIAGALSEVAVINQSLLDDFHNTQKEVQAYMDVYSQLVTNGGPVFDGDDSVDVLEQDGFATSEDNLAFVDEYVQKMEAADAKKDDKVDGVVSFGVDYDGSICLAH